VASTVLYDDGRCVLDEDGLTLRHYYFPFGTSKRIRYGQILDVSARSMTWLTGKGGAGVRRTLATGCRWT